MDTSLMDEALKSTSQPANIHPSGEKSTEEFILTPEEEADFINCISTTTNTCFGMTRFQLCKLIYDFMVYIKKEPPKSWIVQKSADENWFQEFHKKHRNIKLYSLIYQQNSNVFLANLKNLYDVVKINPNNIWYVEEIGIATSNVSDHVITRPTLKLFENQINIADENIVSVTIAVSAVGKSMTPFFITSTESENSSILPGWATKENSISLINHFIEHAKPSKQNPVLILFSHHEPHLSIKSLKFFKEHDIYVRFIPSCNSRRLIPLQDTTFEIMKTIINKTCKFFIENNQESTLATKNIPTIINSALSSAIKIENIKAGFQTAGIFPLFKKKKTSTGQVLKTRLKYISKSDEKAFVESLKTPVGDCFTTMSPRTRSLAYDFILKIKKKIPITWHRKKIVPEKWFQKLHTRHPDILIYKPGSKNQNNSLFLSNLIKANKRFKFSPDNIWNIDEIGVTASNVSNRVVTRVKDKIFGNTVSVLFGFSAAGTSLPPFLIFPKKDNIDLSDYNRIDSETALTSSGWMTKVECEKFVHFFIEHSKPSPKNPVLLLMKNCESFISLEALSIFNKNWITVMSFPPGCKSIPIDKTIISSLKYHINFACEKWISCNPEDSFSIENIPQIIETALSLAGTKNHIKVGFKSAGICPLRAFTRKSRKKIVFFETVENDGNVTSKPYLSEKSMNSMQRTVLRKKTITKMSGRALKEENNCNRRNGTVPSTDIRNNVSKDERNTKNINKSENLSTVQINEDSDCNPKLEEIKDSHLNTSTESHHRQESLKFTVKIFEDLRIKKNSLKKQKLKRKVFKEIRPLRRPLSKLATEEIQSVISSSVLPSITTEDNYNLEMSKLHVETYKKLPMENIKESFVKDLITPAGVTFTMMPVQIRSLAYEFLLLMRIKIPYSWHKNQAAPRRWLSELHKKHPEVLLWTKVVKENVDLFFKNLKNTYDRFEFDPSNIWNMDVIFVAVNVPQWVILENHLELFESYISSVLGYSAAGTTLPPFFILPADKYKAQSELIQSDIALSPDGCFTREEWKKFAYHFIRHTKPSKDKPVLLLINNYETISIEVLIIFKKNWVIIQSLPPAGSRKWLPLRKSIWEPLKNYINVAIGKLKKNNIERVLSVTNIVDIIKAVLLSTSSKIKIQMCFRYSGIYPFFVENEYNSDFSETSHKKEYDMAITIKRELSDTSEQNMTNNNKKQPSTSRKACLAKMFAKALGDEDNGEQNLKRKRVENDLLSESKDSELKFDPGFKIEPDVTDAFENIEVKYEPIDEIVPDMIDVPEVKQEYDVFETNENIETKVEYNHEFDHNIVKIEEVKQECDVFETSTFDDLSTQSSAMALTKDFNIKQDTHR